MAPRSAMQWTAAVARGWSHPVAPAEATPGGWSEPELVRVYEPRKRATDADWLAALNRLGTRATVDELAGEMDRETGTTRVAMRKLLGRGLVRNLGALPGSGRADVYEVVQ